MKIIFLGLIFIINARFLIEELKLLKSNNIQKAEGSFFIKYPRVRNVLFFGIMFILLGILVVKEILLYNN